MAEKIVAVKGMNDILPPHSAQWEWLESRVRTIMARFAYRNLRTPILEQTRLFVRSLGEVTDVVEKEMYSFQDRNDKYGDSDHLTLRPEGTAGVVRATVEHNLLYEGGKRVYYMGPMFRRERPQRGRYRQFHQIGAEALGFAGAHVDAELILLAQALWQDLGIQNVRLELNCLGQPEERQQHRAALIAYLEQHAEQLDEDARRRLHSNPLRILDTKNPAMQALVDAAPRLIDYLGDASRAHFNAVQAILDANGIAYSVNPRLVRGLDYYNLTVFEFITESLGAQGTICAGGRYDYLLDQIGGKPAPCVGWACGMERLLELLKEQNLLPAEDAPHAYAIVPDAAAMPQVLQTLQQLRAKGLHVQMHASATAEPSSMKSQFKKADASGAHYALIFGADELAQNSVMVKHLRDGSGQQTLYPLSEMSEWAKRLQSDPCKQ